MRMDSNRSSRFLRVILVDENRDYKTPQMYHFNLMVYTVSAFGSCNYEL